MGFRDYQPAINRFTVRDTFTGALADLNLGTNPWTGNRYSPTGGNPITGIEIDGHKIYLENFGSVSVTRANASDSEIQRASQRVAENPEASHMDSVPYEEVLEFMTDEMKTNPESETVDAISAKFSPWCGYDRITASWNCEKDGLTMWADAVKTGGPWDHKGPLHDLLGVSDKNAILYTKIPGTGDKVRYVVWSNIHYVRTELKISRATLQGGAVLADLMDNGHLNPEDVEYAPEELTQEVLNQAIMEPYDEFVQLGIIRSCSDNSEGVTVGC